MDKIKVIVEYAPQGVREMLAKSAAANNLTIFDYVRKRSSYENLMVTKYIDKVTINYYKSSLLNIIDDSSKDEQSQELVQKIRHRLDWQTIQTEKSLQDLLDAVGYEKAVKMIAMPIKMFMDSLNFEKKLEAFQLKDVCLYLLREYNMLSWDDTVLALKEATLYGKKFYASFGVNDYFEIINEHIYKKMNMIEQRHLDNKSGQKNYSDVLEAINDYAQKKGYEPIKIEPKNQEKKEKIKLDSYEEHTNRVIETLEKADIADLVQALNFYNMKGLFDLAKLVEQEILKRGAFQMTEK